MNAMKKPPRAPDLQSERTLEVSKTQKYGKTRYWPQNQTAQLFVHLLGQESFSETNIERIKLLGYRVLLTPPKVEGTEL